MEICNKEVRQQKFTIKFLQKQGSVWVVTHSAAVIHGSVNERPKRTIRPHECWKNLSKVLL